jgi:hypothetical protein
MHENARRTMSIKQEVNMLKPMATKNKILWGVSMIGLLAISYWLCRFVFFGIHGMKQWPNLLAIVGWITIVIASIGGRRLLSIATVVGYIGGFVIGMIFNTDGVDQGGGGINNTWKIWGIVFISTILISIILEYIFKQRYKKTMG